MIKRSLAALVWFYVAWVGWNVVAYMTGWSILLGPVVATMVSALVAGDPMHRIWTARASRASSLTLVNGTRSRA
jgi:hypothetical protein